MPGNATLQSMRDALDETVRTKESHLDQHSSQSLRKVWANYVSLRSGISRDPTVEPLHPAASLRRASSEVTQYPYGVVSSHAFQPDGNPVPVAGGTTAAALKFGSNGAPELLHNDNRAREPARMAHPAIRRTHYVNLISFMLFTTFCAAIVSFQRQAFLCYDVHKSLAYLLPSDDNGVASEFRSIMEVHAWLSSTVQDIWIDPICGNGICDAPFEEKAYGRFGCQKDCGWREDLQEITVNLGYTFFTEETRESSLWNICREDQCSLSAIDPTSPNPQSCYFLSAGRFNYSTALEGNISATVYLPLSSKWEFCLVTAAPVLPLAGTISHVFLSEEQRNVKGSDPLGYLGSEPAEANGTLVASGNGNLSDGQGSASLAQLGGAAEMTQLQEWTHGGMVPPCHRDCLAASACLVRCEWGLDNMTSQLDVALPPFKPQNLSELCEKQAGCDANPYQRLPVDMLDCHNQEGFLDWLLRGVPYGEPEAPLLQGSYSPAPSFSGDQQTVFRLASFVDWCQVDMGEVPDASPCAPECAHSNLGNGVCDDACLTEACYYDLTDCCTERTDYNGDTYYLCPLLSSRDDSQNQIGTGLYRFQFTVPSSLDADPIDANDTAGEPLPSSEDVEQDSWWRMAGVTNRIIAGMLIQQHRTPWQKMDENKKFQLLFDLEFNYTQKDAAPFGANPHFLHASTMYKPDLRNSTGQFFTPDQLSKQGTPLAFFPVRHRGRDIFPVFIDIRMTTEEALTLVEYLQEASFLDIATEEVEVQIIAYNSALEYFGLLDVSFRRQPGGAVLIRSTIQVFSLNMYNARGERVRAVGEVLLVLMVIAGTYFELKQMASAAKAGRLRDYFANVANFIDFVSISLFYVCIALWTYFLVRYHGKFDIALSYQPYRTHFGSDNERLAKTLELADGGAVMLELLDKFEEVQVVSRLVDLYSFLTALNLLLMVLRVLKLTDFHPRLGIITKTINRAITDIAHYLLVVSSLFLCFATMAHISFGTILAEFSNLENAINTCFLLVIGEAGINEKLMDMQGVQLIMAWVFFWLYIIIMYFILINFFVAFIIASFSDHMSNAAHRSSTVTHDLRDILHEVARRCRALLRRNKGPTQTREETDGAMPDALASLTTGTKAVDAGTADAAGAKSAPTSQVRTSRAGYERDVEANGGEIKTHHVGGRLERLVLSVKERLSGDATSDGGSVEGSIGPARAGGIDASDDHLVHWASGGGSMEGDVGRHSISDVGGRGTRVVVDTEHSPTSSSERRTIASTILSMPRAGRQRLQARRRERAGERYVVIDGHFLTEDELAKILMDTLHSANLAGQPGAEVVDDGSEETEGVGDLAARSKRARAKEDVVRSMGRGSRLSAEKVRTSLSSWCPLGRTVMDEEDDLESSRRCSSLLRCMPLCAKGPAVKVGNVAAYDAAREIARHAIERFGTVITDEVARGSATGGAGKLDAPGAVAASAMPDNPTVQLAEMLGGLQAHLVEMESRYNILQAENEARLAMYLSQLAQSEPPPRAQHTDSLLSHDMVPGPAQVGTQLQGEAGGAGVVPSWTPG